MVSLTMVTLQLKHSVLYIESLGYLATISESLLTIPQMVQNFKERSVKGMRHVSFSDSHEHARVNDSASDRDNV